MFNSLRPNSDSTEVKITNPTENLILHWDRKALTETAIDRKILKKELDIKRLKDQGAMVTACSPKPFNS